MTMMKENEQEMQHGHDEMPIVMDASESEHENESVWEVLGEARLGATGDMPFAYRVGLPDEHEIIDVSTKQIITPRAIRIKNVTFTEFLDRVEAALKRQMSQSWHHGGAGAWGVIARIGNAIQKKMETSPQSVTAHEYSIMNACHRALAERPQTVLSRIETLGRLEKELAFCEDNVKKGVGFTPFGLEKHCDVLREIVVALEAHEGGVSR